VHATLSRSACARRGEKVGALQPRDGRNLRPVGEEIFYAPWPYTQRSRPGPGRSRESSMIPSRNRRSAMARLRTSNPKVYARLATLPGEYMLVHVASLPR